MYPVLPERKSFRIEDIRIKQILKKIILNTESKYFWLVLKIAKMAHNEVKMSLSKTYGFSKAVCDNHFKCLGVLLHYF